MGCTGKYGLKAITYAALSGLFLCLSPLNAPPAIAQTLEIDAAQAPVIGLKALLSGRAELALRIADAVVQSDPKDVAGWLLKARAHLALGGFDAARAAAAQAERILAPDDPDAGFVHHVAARVRGLAHAHDGNSQRASWQLRRALQYAPDPGAAADVRKIQAQLRMSRPLNLHAQLSFAPSSNINNATSAEFIELFGLPFALSGDARALSGTTAMAGVSGSYRVARTPSSQTALTFRGSAVGHRLSSQARLQAPDARGSDFSQAVLEAGISHIRRLSETLQGRASLTQGRSWSGGDILYDTSRFSLGIERKHEGAGQSGTELSFTRRHTNDGFETTERRLGQTLSWPVSPADHKLTLGVHVIDAQADRPVDRFGALGANARLSLAEPIFGADLSLSAGIEQRAYEASTFGGMPRDDLTQSLGAFATFQSLETFGFSPQISLQMSKTRSNQAIYDRESTSLGFGIVSTF